MKTITLNQVIVLVACMAAPILAFKFLGSAEAAAATYGVGLIVNFLLGRNSLPSGQ